MGKLFLDERNLQQLGLNQQNIATLRALTEFANLQSTVATHSAILDPLIALTTYGLLAYTANDAFATRTLTGPAAGLTVANGDGVTANPTLALANDLAALEAMSGTGFVARTASETYAQRTLTAPAAGFTITNPAGIAGNPTFALANGLASLEGASSTGSIYYYSAADTWSPVTIGSGVTFSGGTLSATGLGGTVTSVSVVTANGVSGSVATATTTPAITLTLGAITPTSVVASGSVTGSNLSGNNTGDQVEASNAEVWAGSVTTKFIGPNRFYAAEVPQTATSSATITLDGTAGLNFDITLDTNAALANPINFQTGRAGMIRITQDATGSRSMTFGSNWRFAGGAPSLTTTASAIDVITFFVWSATMIIATMSNDYTPSAGDGSLLLAGDMQSGTDKLKLGGDMTDGDDVLRIQS